MQVMKQADEIRAKFEIPRPVHKARDIICRLIYDMAFAKAMNAEEENRLPPPEFNDERTREMAQTYGIWIWQLARTVQDHLLMKREDSKVCFQIGDIYLISRTAGNLAVAMGEFRQANPFASMVECIDYLVFHNLAEEVGSPKGHVFKFYW